MGYSLKDKIKSGRDWDFQTEVRKVLSFIKKHWDISALPKEYEEFIRNYRDYQGMDDIPAEKALCKEFQGFIDEGTLSFPFPVRVSLPHVAYEAKNQSCPPLESLIGAVMGYGMLAGMRLELLTELSDSRCRMNHLDHVYHSMVFTKDEHLQVICLKEAGEIVQHPEISLDEIRKKYNEKRRNYLKGFFLKDMKEYLAGRTRRKAFVHGSRLNKDKKFYSLLSEMSYACKSPNHFIEVMNELGFKVKHEQSIFYVSIKKDKQHA